MKLICPLFGITLVSMASLVKADWFANFFDDENCSINGGAGVSIRNTGCLEEAGRGSVYIPNNGLLNDNYCLVITDSEGCGCQSDSVEVYTNGYCLPLLNTNAVSYRFVHGECGADTC